VEDSSRRSLVSAGLPAVDVVVGTSPDYLLDQSVVGRYVPFLSVILTPGQPADPGANCVDDFIDLGKIIR
jgi:hypothetical protein